MRLNDRVHSIIKNFVGDGTIPVSRIDESYKRIMRLKEKLNSSQSDYYREAWLNTQKELESYKTQLEQSESELEILKNKPVVEKEEPKKKKRKN